MANKLKPFMKKVVPDVFWERLRSVRSNLESVYQVIKVRSQLSRFSRRVVRHCYGGKSLNVVIADKIAEEWYDRDWPELREIEFLRAHRLVTGAKVFDIGAHQGVVALMLADAVGVDGKVVAVEANEHNVSIAKENCRLNTAGGSVDLVHAAAGRHSGGTITFSRDLNGHVSSNVPRIAQMKVATTSVDALALSFGNPDVLFIDVEGFECEVLRGAAVALQRNPDCVIEVHSGCGLEHFGGSVAGVYSFFPPDRFSLYTLPEDESKPARKSVRPDPPGDRFFLLAIGRTTGSGGDMIAANGNAG